MRLWPTRVWLIVLKFLADPPRFMFLTGKGGVGKTSIACASAVLLADQGKRVLLVSTDPASNIGQVFGVDIGNAITKIPGVPELEALEIDPEAAAQDYRERIVAPVRGLLPEREIQSITEQLSGSCTTEVASFDEFTGLLTNDELTETYDHIVFDTAPTGHTIRLLQLPGSWSDFLEAGKGDASCLGPLAGLEKQRSSYLAAVTALKNPSSTRLVLVSRAQESALQEVARTRVELAHAGIDSGYLVINALLPKSDDEDALAESIRHRERHALELLPESLRDLPRDEIHLRAANVMGLAALRNLLADIDGEPDLAVTGSAIPEDPGLCPLVDEIEADGKGLVLCMGKGGVGKTTIAAAIAVELALRGHAVHLTTTDPAAHLQQTLGEEIPNLRVTRIDPAEATQRYREHVIATKGAQLDDVGRAHLIEDLMSPCTEEVAVFREFASVIREARRAFVIVDTAPTGHTLLLLDATGSYHRDIVRQMGGQEGIVTPMMMLQDPALTKVVIVTLPEQTPVLEAKQLQYDLDRAGIKTWAWVVNNSVSAAQPTSAFLLKRAASEVEPLKQVRALSPRVARVPLQEREPIGAEYLEELVCGRTDRVPVGQG